MSFLAKVGYSLASTNVEALKAEFEKRLLPFTADVAAPKKILAEAEFRGTSIILYRAVVTDKLNENHVGLSWCWKGEYVWPYDGLHERPDTPVYILKALVPLDAIDYEKTGRHMVGYSSEHEIKLLKNNRITLIESRYVGMSSDVARNGFDFDNPHSIEKKQVQVQAQYKAKKTDVVYKKQIKARDAIMSFVSKVHSHKLATTTLTLKGISHRYPIVKKIGEFEVTENVKNTNSIGATLDDYHIVKGIREVPISEFGDTKHAFYAADDWKKSEKLALAIQENKYIDPLIVVLDDEGLYILEGAHRWVALAKLNVKSIPALLVIDLEKVDLDAASISAAPKSKIYRGESSSSENKGKGGIGYWSIDPEFAVQFTQTGQMHEVMIRDVDLSHVHDATKEGKKLPSANSETDFDLAIKTAKEKGFYGVRFTEGKNQPDSIYIFNKAIFK